MKKRAQRAKPRVVEVGARSSSRPSSSPSPSRVTPLRSVVMAPPVLQESSIMPINTLEEEEVELEEEKELLCKSKRHRFAGSVVQPQTEIEFPATENENRGPGDVVQSNCEQNGCSEGHVRGSTIKEPEARLRVNKLCGAKGWKYPTYDFEEQGPPYTNLFTCKVTVHVDTITDTIVECFSDPKPQKKAAQEQAFQGVLWCLKCLGNVK